MYINWKNRNKIYNFFFLNLGSLGKLNWIVIVVVNGT